MQQFKALALETCLDYICTADFHCAYRKWVLILWYGSKSQIPSSKGAQSLVWDYQTLEEKVSPSQHLKKADCAHVNRLTYDE